MRIKRWRVVRLLETAPGGVDSPASFYFTRRGAVEAATRLNALRVRKTGVLDAFTGTTVNPWGPMLHRELIALRISNAVNASGSLRRHPAGRTASSKLPTQPRNAAEPSYRAFLGESPCKDPSCPCHPKPAPLPDDPVEPDGDVLRSSEGSCRDSRCSEAHTYDVGCALRNTRGGKDETPTAPPADDDTVTEPKR